MQQVDVNVLIYAARKDSPDHDLYAAWLDRLVNGDEDFGISDLVLSGVVRILTNPRIYKQPSTMDEALAFVESVRNSSRCIRIAPGSRQWRIFTGLCRSPGIAGGLVPDAYFAAMAIEAGDEWVTTDHDYARFPGLNWRHPLRGQSPNP